MERNYNYPVYSTSKGGIVAELTANPPRIYLFIEPPNCSGLHVGDRMPEEWQTFPANQLARDEARREDTTGG